jgi:hypothetical protein
MAGGVAKGTFRTVSVPNGTLAAWFRRARWFLHVAKVPLAMVSVVRGTFAASGQCTSSEGTVGFLAVQPADRTAS